MKSRPGTAASSALMFWLIIGIEVRNPICSDLGGHYSRKWMHLRHVVDSYLGGDLTEVFEFFSSNSGKD